MHQQLVRIITHPSQRRIQINRNPQCIPMSLVGKHRFERGCPRQRGAEGGHHAHVDGVEGGCQKGVDEGGEGVGKQGSPERESPCGGGGGGGCGSSWSMTLSVHTAPPTALFATIERRRRRRKRRSVTHHPNVHHATHRLVPRAHPAIVQRRHALHPVRLIIKGLTDLSQLGRGGSRDDHEDGLYLGAYQREVGGEETGCLGLEEVGVEVGEGGHDSLNDFGGHGRCSPLAGTVGAVIIVIHRKLSQYKNLIRMQNDIVLQYQYNLR
mmetsp:Transcript_22206/g.39928  ORF Transcript_22206/g.39928 Transcript_22206/m.39928 type:complete len:267 (-) Transcript_22206:1301-2101(-)